MHNTTKSLNSISESMLLQRFLQTPNTTSLCTSLDIQSSCVLVCDSTLHCGNVNVYNTEEVGGKLHHVPSEAKWPCYREVKPFGVDRSVYWLI